MKAGLLVDTYLFNIFCTYYLGGSLQVLNIFGKESFSQSRIEWVNPFTESPRTYLESINKQH